MVNRGLSILNKLECIEQRVIIPFNLEFNQIRDSILSKIPHDVQVLRFITSEFNKDFNAHLLLSNIKSPLPNIFKFRKRSFENEENFNVCFSIPTGIGCEIGGHAGDATPALRLIASQCDRVITHPNVVNASDINEAPANAWYVEGYHFTKLLMGTAGLMNSRKNRILVLIDSNESRKRFVDLAINSVNAARATLGIEARILRLESKIKMEALMQKNKASGKLTDLDYLIKLLEEEQKQSSFDAVAISSCIKVPENTHTIYSTSDGNMVNPWGGVESMLTHLISSKFDIPCAHAPMFESEAIANLDLGVVDSRIAPEIVSSTFFHCVLKGLHNAPKVVLHENGLAVEDISALVIPDGILGLPVLAALHQGIKVIAVKNKNEMKNDLRKLPWQSGQFFQCDNYLEACGILGCLRDGISVETVKRPLKTLERPLPLNRLKEEHLLSIH